MDHMEGDQIVDIPDTPDRLTNLMVNQRNGVNDEKSHRSMFFHTGKQDFREGTKDQPIFIDSGTKNPPVRFPNVNSSSTGSLRNSKPSSFAGGRMSSCRSTPIFRKGLADKIPTNESHDSIHIPQIQNERSSSASNSFSSQDGCYFDPTKRNVLGKSFSGGTHGSSDVDDIRSRTGLANVSSTKYMEKFLMPSGEASGRTEDMCKVGSSVDNGEDVNLRIKQGQSSFPASDPISSSKVIHRQKRFVRNGCISPHNIAKAKHLAGKDDNGSVAVASVETNSMASSGSAVLNDLKELVTEDCNSYIRKGKGVMNHPCPAKELENKNKHIFGRNTLSINEKDSGTTDQGKDASKSIEISGGWRSTQNRTRKTSLHSSDDGCFLTREIDASRRAGKQQESRMLKKGSGVVIDGGYPKDLDMVSSQHIPAQPVGEAHPRPQLARLNGHFSPANKLLKRQKQGSFLGGSGEGSTSTNDDPENLFLSSSVEPSNSRSTSTTVGRLQSIIEINDSPELKHNACDEDARARQLEEDEKLARELQEQLYNEMPVLGVGEVDANIAFALQQEESSHAISGGSNRVLGPRDSLMANLRRQSQPRSLNFSHRGSRGRASTSGRMTRLRGRFPGRPRTLSSSSVGRNSLFPANMDVDMRMHILETMEAFSDMGVESGVLQIQHDFNETDYEMLLALDENNDHHGGASVRQINGLPQSTVQNDNFEEACAICLDTPTTGDTIRHLPCLHKFHKDCIDPWLRRRTSCPVCKSSIT